MVRAKDKTTRTAAPSVTGSATPGTVNARLELSSTLGTPRH